MPFLKTLKFYFNQFCRGVKRPNKVKKAIIFCTGWNNGSVLLTRLLQVKRVPARGSSPPTSSGGGRSGRRNRVARTDLPETSATKGLKALVGKAAATSSDHVWKCSRLATNSIFFLFPFCGKSLTCLEGKSMTPHRGNTILFHSSQQLPRLHLGRLKGFLR